FVPVFVGLLGLRWFRSRAVACPVAKTIGAMALLVFSPALLRLLPWELRWRHAVPIEGLLGRIVGDTLIHYFNIVGAYIVCATLIAIALYLTTAFSFSLVPPTCVFVCSQGGWDGSGFFFFFCGRAALPGLPRTPRQTKR